ncbi:MAG: hypothetical protein M1830_002627 [Pleopsidium flavum]|nr:MAG: hypothetical protein M1830_002627 [Pleopsidium flavum]
MASPDSSQPIHVDGRTLEGGGQLVRVALCLSSLTSLPIHITSIRGSRGNKGGGLKGSHLAAVGFLARMCKARTEGMELKSKDLLFEPCQVQNESGVVREGQGWRESKDRDGRVVGREMEIKMATPGSVFLVFQALLPYLVFSSFPDPNHDNSDIDSALPSNKSRPQDQWTPLPITVTIHGGTHTSNSPSFEYTQQVLLPTLVRIGLPPITLKLHKRGWTNGRPQIGSVTFTLTPLAPGSFLPAFSLVQNDNARVSAIQVSILAPSPAIRDQIRTIVTTSILAKWDREVEVTFPVDEDSGHPKRLYLLLVAETSRGCRYGRDWLYDRKIGHAGDVVEALVEKVVGDLHGEVKGGGAVDEFMEDQLVIFQALARGRSVVGGVEKGDLENASTQPTLHTQTARWVAKTILDIQFVKHGGCKGVGFTVRERNQKRQQALMTEISN